MLNTLIGFMGEVVFYYCSRAVFYFPRSLKISSVYEWNSSRSSCTGGKFYELSKRKWARFANKLLSTTSTWRTLILSNLGRNRLCFLIKYSVFRYYQLSFNINSRYQTPLAKTWYFQIILCWVTTKVVPCTVYHQSSPSTVVCTYQNFFIILYKCRHQL